MYVVYICEHVCVCLCIFILVINVQSIHYDRMLPLSLHADLSYLHWPQNPSDFFMGVVTQSSMFSVHWHRNVKHWHQGPVLLTPGQRLWLHSCRTRSWVKWLEVTWQIHVIPCPISETWGGEGCILYAPIWFLTAKWGCWFLYSWSSHIALDDIGCLGVQVFSP